MPIRVGEQTVAERMRDAELEVRRIAAAHSVALRKYNDFNDAVRRLVLTPEMKAQQETLLKTCQELWEALDETNNVVRWYVSQINRQHKRW